ncbi:MAG: tRNA (adenosine(37)-N6)-dimethylallyltransferase MiaA [Lachnospiraceae bacterium]|nr:tRNA (adenosine(37)-N6)-dimethylallyltransferase MiaA [Lachnospiraceae bacterium]
MENQKKRPLIVLTGPTSVGKTKLSIALAKAVNGEIISADSMQVYHHMDIGTAKITKEEMDGVNHYLVDQYEPDEEFNVVEFQKEAKKAIEEIYAKGKIPLIVGGTGFYIQAVLNDIDFTENEQDTTYRRELEELANKEGAGVLHQMLREVDEESAEAIHENNVKKVIRALEFFKMTGEPISKHNVEQRAKKSPYQFMYFVLDQKRDVLYANIDKRVDIMMENGLLEEVKRLKEMGYDRSLVSMQGIGYKEILAYLEGECSLEEAVYIIKRDTRHFAKRQMTWFRRERDVTMVPKQDFENDEDKILEYMLKLLREKGILS